jgi:hypothetical protein
MLLFYGDTGTLRHERSSPDVACFSVLHDGWSKNFASNKWTNAEMDRCLLTTVDGHSPHCLLCRRPGILPLD